MMAGSTSALQSEAGYIDARPQIRQIDENLLRRTAGPYIWVKPGPRALSRTLPLSHRQRNSTSRRAMSQSCQFRTHAPQQTASSFKHLVGAGEHRGRDGETQSLGGLEVDYQLELRGLLDGQVGGLGALEDPIHEE